jgi:hypothetical protein
MKDLNMELTGPARSREGLARIAQGEVKRLLIAEIAYTG